MNPVITNQKQITDSQKPKRKELKWLQNRIINSQKEKQKEGMNKELQK